MKLGFLLLYSKEYFFNFIYRNDYVVSYKEAFFEENSQSLCIIMEFADNGDLQSKIEN